MQSMRSLATFWTNLLDGSEDGVEELTNQRDPRPDKAVRRKMRRSRRRVAEWLEVIYRE